MAKFKEILKKIKNEDFKEMLHSFLETEKKLSSTLKQIKSMSDGYVYVTVSTKDKSLFSKVTLHNNFITVLDICKENVEDKIFTLIKTNNTAFEIDDLLISVIIDNESNIVDEFLGLRDLGQQVN